MNDASTGRALFFRSNTGHSKAVYSGLDQQNLTSGASLPQPRALHLGACAPLALLALAACGKEPPPSFSLATPVGAYGGGDVLADPGVPLTADVDDDDRDGVIDWEQRAAVGNDQAILLLSIKDKAVRLTFSSAAGGARLWRNGEVLLDAEEAGESSFELNAGERAVSLAVQLRDPLGAASLTLVEIDEEGVEGEPLVVPFRAAPLLLNHHLQPATHLWAMSVSSGGLGDSYENTSMISEISAQLGEDFTPIPGGSYGYDVWVQDELELGTMSAPESFMDFVIDSIRSGGGRGLDDVPEDFMEDADFGRATWGAGSRATSQDSFGNLECSPPVTVDGVEYPFGRVYYGIGPTGGPVKALQEMLDAQQLQRPFSLDTSWLIVGHVDEFISTIPDPAAPHGFWVIVSDADVAWEVLESLDPDTELTRWNGRESRYEGHDMDTVGDILNEPGLRELNEDITRDHVEPNLELFLTELGLSESDVIRIPGLFYEPWGRAYGAVALLPGMANLTVWNPEGEGVKLFMADPFIRGEGVEQSADPMIAAVRALMPPSVEAVFLDDWYVYHMGLGEVHCGTNVSRAPLADWWTVGLHLLQD